MTRVSLLTIATVTGSRGNVRMWKMMAPTSGINPMSPSVSAINCVYPLVIRVVSCAISGSMTSLVMRWMPQSTVVVQMRVPMASAASTMLTPPFPRTNGHSTGSYFGFPRAPARLAAALPLI